MQKRLLQLVSIALKVSIIKNSHVHNRTTLSTLSRARHKLRIKDHKKMQPRLPNLQDSQALWVLQKTQLPLWSAPDSGLGLVMLVVGSNLDGLFEMHLVKNVN